MLKFLLILIVFITPSLTRNIQCIYFTNTLSTPKYTCQLNTLLLKQGEEATSVSGEHLPNFSDQNVTVFFVSNFVGNTLYSPIRMCHHLPYFTDFILNHGNRGMKREIFQNCNELKRIFIKNHHERKIDENLFADVSSVEEIHIIDTSIEAMPKNLFKNNQALKVVKIKGNILKIIETEFPKKLSVLSLLGNRCISDLFDESDQKSTPFDVVIKKVEENCQVNSSKENYPVNDIENYLVGSNEHTVSYFEEFLISINKIIDINGSKAYKDIEEVNFKITEIKENLDEVENLIKGELSEKLSNASELIEQENLKISEISGKELEMDFNMENTLKLKEENEEISLKIDKSENYLITLFICQIFTLLLAGFLTFYVKNWEKFHEVKRVKMRVGDENLVVDVSL